MGAAFIAILSSSLILLHTIWKIFWLIFNWFVLGKLQGEADHGTGVHIAGDTSSGDLEEKAGEKAKKLYTSESSGGAFKLRNYILRGTSKVSKTEKCNETETCLD